MNEIHRHFMKPFIIECGIIHNRLQALVYLLSLKWLPPVVEKLRGGEEGGWWWRNERDDPKSTMMWLI